MFIIGCNSGNIPGDNRSTHMSDYEYRNEQRRLLYVGFTRAKQSLTVSWSRNIPFDQAKRHYTKSIGTRTFGKRRVSRVGLCDFLGDLASIEWEN